MVLLHGLGQLFASDWAVAGSLKATADRMGEEMTQIGVALGVVFLVIAGGSIAMGLQDGNTKLFRAIVGLIVILSATGIIRLIKSVV